MAEMSEATALIGTHTMASGWRQGTLTNLLNPKVGVFYVAVLPLFIPVGAPHVPMGLLLTGVHMLLGLTGQLCSSPAGEYCTAGFKSPRHAVCWTGSPAPSSPIRTAPGSESKFVIEVARPILAALARFAASR